MNVNVKKIYKRENNVVVKSIHALDKNVSAKKLDDLNAEVIISDSNINADSFTNVNNPYNESINQVIQVLTKNVGTNGKMTSFNIDIGRIDLKFGFSDDFVCDDFVKWVNTDTFVISPSNSKQR